MVKTVFVAVLLLMLTASCHSYKEYDKESFATYTWKDQEVSFTPEIEDITKSYRIILGLRHHYGLQTKSFGVNLKIVSPSGKESSKDFDVTIMDDKNKPVGSCAGDICDLETVVFDNLKFDEAGKHKVSISHTKEGFIIPGIMEVGLIIDEN
jgi:gliding motility-associated lipoprotein GldH